MQEALARPAVAAAVVDVAVDHLHIDETTLARLLRLEPESVAAMRRGEKVAAGRETDVALGGMAAIQSLLLSAYTPASAGQWMLEPNPALAGDTPLSTLASGGDEAVGMVLRAAFERVS